MKKIMFAAAVAVAVLLSGCKQATSNIETVKADALDITAKALPGFNYVTWSAPVDGSTVAALLRDDGQPVTGYVATKNYVLDTNVQDGAKYTYTVYTGNPSDVKFQFASQVTNATTTINDVDTLEGYRLEGNSASASCTAINPTYIKDGKLMEAIELCDYEEGCDKNYVINEDNIILEEINGKLTVAFPTKNYLSYTAKLYRGNGYELFGRDKASDVTTNFTIASGNNDAVADSFYSNNGSYRYDSAVVEAGKYFVEVTVTAKNAKAYSPSYVKSAKTIELAPLDIESGKGTGTPVVGYIDAGKTARLVWTPAVKADTTKWAADSYKVYVKDAKDVYTEIAPAKAAKLDEEGNEVKDEDGNVVMEAKLAIAAGARAGKDVYYIDYAIPDNKLAYDFYVVLSDNGKYESLAKTANLVKYAELSELTVDAAAKQIKAGATTLADYATANADLDKATGTTVAPNDVCLNFTNVDANLVIKSVKYKIVDMNDNGTYTTDTAALILDPEFKDAATLTAEYSKQTLVVKNVKENSKVVFLVTVNAKKNGKEAYKDTVFAVVSGAVANATPTIQTGEFTVTAPAGAANAAKTVKVKVTPASYENNAQYTYAVYYAKVVNGASVASVTSWTPVAVTIAYDAATTKWTGTSADVTLDPTTVAKIDNKDGTPTRWADDYVFKFVKINKTDVNKFAVDYDTATCANITKTK